MPNKPAPVTDAELAELLEAGCKCRVRFSNSDDPGEAVDGVTYSIARCPLCSLAPALAQELIRLREVLRQWDDHLPGCSGSPRCECGYLEAQALLGEVPDAQAE